MAFDILIVDDEPDIRYLVSETLSDEGYSCRQAADGDRAVDEIEDRLPNLVILDISQRCVAFSSVGVHALACLRAAH